MWLGSLLRTGALCCGCLVCSRCRVGLRSLLVASGDVLVLKPLPYVKIWYVFGVLLKK
jgi:hypothetical protein